MRFMDFASAHGLAIRELRADGQIHRCPTVAKPRSDNGAYMVDNDRGWVMDWATSDQVQWWQDENAKPWTAEQKAEAEAKRLKQARERMELARQAAQKARTMIETAELVSPRPGRDWKPGRPAVEPIYAHPYLVRKGFPTEPGFILDGELLIPMFDLFKLDAPIGLQRINADGEKKYLYGQRSKGAIYRMGSGAREVWLCEGYATALTVRAAIKKLYRRADVVACFSAGNLIYVASRGVGTHVMADNDESKTGQEAAEATGLCWTMPAQKGMDANDVHLAEGLDAVCELMQRRI